VYNFRRGGWPVKPPPGVRLRRGGLAHGLIAAFPLNEQGGAAINIVSGVRYAPVNGAAIISTQFGRMLDCNGAKGVVGDAELALVAQTPLSIFWSGVHLGNPSGNANYAGVTYTNGDTNPYSGYGVATNGAGSIVAQFNDGSYHDIVDNQPTVIGLNQRNAIGLVYVPGSQALYVNSRAQTSSYSGTTISYSGPKFAIGYDPNNGARDSKSYADVVYVWRRVITRQEFLQLWAQPYAMFEPPGLKLYSFANPAVSTSVSLTGVAASPGIGTIAVQIGVGVAGLALSPGVGTITVGLSTSVSLTGVAAPVGIGSLARTDAAIAGVAAAALAQAPTVDFSTVRGLAASPALGNLTVTTGTNALPSLAGLALSPGVGNLTVSFASFAGVAAPVAAGELTFRGDAQATITGVALASATGQPTVGDITVSYASITGVAATPGIGSIAVSGSAIASITGLSAVAGAGRLTSLTRRRTLMIAGQDRTGMLLVNSLTISRDLTGQTSASFTLIDKRGRYVPQYRDEVVYYFGGRRVFGGLVMKTETQPFDCRTETAITVTCVGYQQICQDRVYTNTFTGPTIDLATVVRDIVNVGLSGEGLSYGAEETSSLPALRFILPSDSVHTALSKVARDFGYNYWVDEERRIRMQRMKWVLTPFVLRNQPTQAGAVWRSMKVTRDASQYRNSQGIRGRIPLTQPTATNTGEVRMSADTDEIARCGAAVEAVTTVRNVMDLAAAESLAEALRARHGARITEIEFESDRPGWEIGQIVHAFVSSPCVAGMFQVRALTIREVDLTFLRYSITCQAPELPAVEGIDVTDNGDGSRTIDFGFDRDLNLGPGEPWTFTGTGEPNTPDFGPFGEKSAHVTALTTSYVTDHWEVTATLDEWLGTLPGEAIRLAGVEIDATGGHGVSFGDPVGSINNTWTVHDVDRGAKTLVFRAGQDGNKAVDFSGLLYTNAPDGLAYGAQKLGGFDGSWLVGETDGSTLTVYTGQVIHITSIALTAGGDENSWTVRLNLDQVPRYRYATGATGPMLPGDAVSITGMESTTPLRVAGEASPTRAAIIRAVVQDGLNGR
jgi:hypothetical protein